MANSILHQHINKANKAPEANKANKAQIKHQHK